MSDYSKHVVLSSLDNKKRILFLTIPEVFIITIPILIGILFEGFEAVFIMFSGFPLRKIYNRYTAKYPDSLLGGLAYWYFPGRNDRNKSPLPKSYIKEYIS